jgi:DNA repair protein RadC
MMDMAHLDHEQMRILVLDSKNQVVENINRYRGTVNSSVLRAAEVFRSAVIRNCPGVIVCHNHPSGDPTPSPEDLAVTEQLVAAGRVLDIELVDHLIIGQQRFVSLKERLRW